MGHQRIIIFCINKETSDSDIKYKIYNLWGNCNVIQIL